MRSFLQRHEIERRPLNLNDLATEVIRLVRTDADARKVKLAFAPVAELPTVLGDRIQLQQVLLNLLLNAMDATTDSTREGGLVVVRVVLAGRMIEVAVSDNGPGIPVDKLSSLFEPFFTTKPKGLGMGLSISRTIVETHNGQLRAENNPTGGGATFYFSLPVGEKV
jgi:two-component system sensor kinase FixL